jgi:hypothetical protein
VNPIAGYPPPPIFVPPPVFQPWIPPGPPIFGPPQPMATLPMAIVAVDEEEPKVRIVISAPPGVTRVSFCVAPTTNACDRAARDYQQIKDKGAEAAGRIFFVTKPIRLTDHLVLQAEAFQTDTVVGIQRAVVIERRAYALAP